MRDFRVTLRRALHGKTRAKWYLLGALIINGILLCLIWMTICATVHR